MNELIKRLITSFVLLIIFVFSIYNKQILSLLLFFLIIEIYFEFQFLIKKIIKKKNKIILYLILLFILIYLVTTFLFVWFNFIHENILIIKKILFIISICIASDIGGYIFGKILKGKKLTSISPNKTISGMIGSYILSIFFSYLLFNNFIDLKYLIILTIIISTISQAGDIFISFIKRKAKVKNTGKLLPGHGGLLDRFDGLIFAAPLGLLLLKFI